MQAPVQTQSKPSTNPQGPIERKECRKILGFSVISSACARQTTEQTVGLAAVENAVENTGDGAEGELGGE